MALRAGGLRGTHHPFGLLFVPGLLNQCARLGFAPRKALAGHMCTPRFASCWNSRRLRRGLAPDPPAVLSSRYGHALRFYIRPHFVKWPPVAALKLRLVAPTASRPVGFTKQALCKVAFAGVRARQPSALLGRCAPYAPPPVRPSLALRSGCSARRFAQALASGRRPGITGEPRPPAAHPARLRRAGVAHPPPAGTPSTARVCEQRPAKVKAPCCPYK